MDELEGRDQNFKYQNMMLYQKEFQTDTRLQQLTSSILQNPLFQKSKHLKRNFYEILLDPILTKNSTLIVQVNGKTNSGKTSFLNSLIGSNILPTSDRPNTFQLFSLRNNPNLNGCFRIYLINRTEQGNLDFKNKQIIMESQDQYEVKNQIEKLNNEKEDILFYVVETKLQRFEDRDILFIDTPGAFSIQDNQRELALNTLYHINYHIWLHLVPNRDLYQQDSSIKKMISENKYMDNKYGQKKNILLITMIQEIGDLKDIEPEQYDQQNQEIVNQLKNKIQIFLDNKLQEKKSDLQKQDKYDEVWSYCSQIKIDFRGFPITQKVIEENNEKLYKLINTEYDQFFLLTKKEKAFLEIIKFINSNFINFENLDFILGDVQSQVGQNFKSIENSIKFEKQSLIENTNILSAQIETFRIFLCQIIFFGLQQLYENNKLLNGLLLLNLIEVKVINLENLLQEVIILMEQKKQIQWKQELYIFGFLRFSAPIIEGLSYIFPNYFKELLQQKIQIHSIEQLYKQADFLIKQSKKAFEMALEDLKYMKEQNLSSI